jgi:hypothetical protein
MRTELLAPPLQYNGYLITARLKFDSGDHFVEYNIVLNERTNLDRLLPSVIQERYGLTPYDMRQIVEWVEGEIAARNL